ncbi:PI-actitoxin-Avd5a-like [Macrobrachium nipponense]|uniref:PI-actitoxin-Avd5a-like n=1 Tax=Macrobrachium nipponense TaxID=159736 RepID=UPI0030C84136
MIKKGLPTTIFCVVLLVIIGTSVASSFRPNCNRQCTYEFDFICGSDGRNYSNRCHFEIGKCRNPRLRIQCKGRCEECLYG